MNILKSRTAAVAFGAALLVVGGGGVGAYATTMITGANIKDGTVTTADIKNGSLTGSDVRDGSISGTDVAPNTLSSSDLLNGSITGADIKDRSLGSADLAPGTITGAEIKDGTLDTPDMSQNFLNYIQTYKEQYGQQYLHWTNADVASWNGSSGNIPGYGFVIGGITPPASGGDYTYMVTMDVRSKYDTPIQVRFDNKVTSGGAQTMRCVAVPVAGFDQATCSASREFVGGTGLFVSGFYRDGQGAMQPFDNSKVDIEINAVRVG